jgi:hypothetical protein
MIRRTFFLGFTASVALGLAAFAANLPGPWRSWRYSRPIEISDSSGASKISIPADIFPRVASGFADLRIIDEAGREIAFVRYDKNVRPPIQSRRATIRENSFVPDQYTQLVIDLGEKASFHNTIQVNTTATDFMYWADVAASDDAETWRIVNDRAPIAVLRKEHIAGSRQVHYSDNNARFLRVRIFDPTQQFPVTTVQVMFSREAQEPTRASLPAQFSPDPTAPATSSRWVADLGPGSFPVSGVAFETTQPEFFRVVHIETSEDGKEWQYFFSGEIYRYTQGDKQAESLRVLSRESGPRRFWRVEVLNGNDAPLVDAKPTLLMIPYFLVFYPQSGHSYRLIYGNSKAQLPHYDLSQTFDYHAESSAKIAALGAEEATSDYRDPRPYTEKHANVLWFAVVVAVILLAWAAFGAMRMPPGATSSTNPS